MARSDRRWWHAGLVAAIVAVGVCVPAVVAVAGASGGQPEAPAVSVKTSAAGTLERRLASTLEPAVAAGSSELVDVLVRVKPGSGVPTGLEYPLHLHLAASADDVYTGRVRADRIAKLATAAHVRYVADNRPVDPPGIPDVPSLDTATRRSAAVMTAAKIAAATRSGAVRAWAASFDARGRQTRARDTVAAGTTPSPTGWFDVGATHRSAEAWALGYTGAGVTVGVADTGVDFAHPDLAGTQATVSDRDSAYLGWPLAYDPFSLLLYASDAQHGTANVAGGRSWFSDTRATVTRDDAGKTVYSDVTYTLPALSRSGSFHIGYLNDENLEELVPGFAAGRVPILVTDETVAGVYDTVRVDLNANEDFTDDKPCTKDSPIAYLDYWSSREETTGPDGYADLSGGMVYWIADGTHQPPGYSLHFRGGTRPGAGDLVCFMGSLDVFADHGTLCASSIVGQGVIDGASINGEHPTFKGTGSGGMVQGGGQQARLVGIGDIYMAGSAFTMAYDFAARGLDGVARSGDELQALSCSFGNSDVDNDEWDYDSRYITQLNTTIAPCTVYVISSGNGGPGYGTNTAPTPSTGISVGASTQFGAAGGWDSIVSADQVTVGDVIPWSNRGPSAMGNAAVNVVADGAYSAGALPLNEVILGDHFDGWRAWMIWGGTSRSAPVAAGNLTLVQQAFKARTGRWPTWSEARTLLMNGAHDLTYDGFVQGAGMIDAARSVELAAGLHGLQITPSAWTAGDFRGTKPMAFTHLMHPGDRDATTVKLANQGDTAIKATLRDVWHQRAWTKTLTLTLDPTQESAYDFNRPDVLVDLTDMLPTNTTTDLLVIRSAYPLGEMDPTSSMGPTADGENGVRLFAYDWTDVDGNGRFWADADGNGFVGPGELDAGEYERFTYASGRGTSHEIRVQRPRERLHDGIYLGLQHRSRGGGGRVHVTVEISGWNRVAWPWLTLSQKTVRVPGHATRTFTARLSVPSDAPLGAYEGQILVRQASAHTAAVPVVVNVAAAGATTTFGGDTPYETLMNACSVFGGQDWGWRAESGDWRFLFADVRSKDLPDGAHWLVSTSWDAAPTDIDTLIYGPAARTADWPGGPERHVGPYDLTRKGASQAMNLGGGRWAFQTATGGAAELVAAPLTTGLNLLMLHNVLYAGTSVGTAFEGSTGVVATTPSAVTLRTNATAGTVALKFTTSVDLPGLVGRSSGLSVPQHFAPTISTDQWWRHELTVTNALSLRISTAMANNDIDLSLQRKDGDTWVNVAASTSAGGDERIAVADPAPGTYRVSVYGYAVAVPDAPFAVTIDLPQGDALALSEVPEGPLPAGTTAVVRAHWTRPDGPPYAADTVYRGTIVLGLTAAPRVIEIPVELVPDLTAPEAPQDFSAVAEYRSTTLSWRNDGEDCELTRVLRSTTRHANSPNDLAGQTMILNKAASSLTDGTLAAGTLYYYTAFNRDRAGNWSVAATATATPKDAVRLSPPSLRPRRPTRDVAFTLSGTLAPAHEQATTVTLFIARKVGGRFVRTQELSAEVPAGLEWYSVTATVSRPGTYRVRAFHADEQHVPRFSPFRQFRVQ